MIVAGIGCRRGCRAGDIVALLAMAGTVDVLATPAWKREEPALLEAAARLGLGLWFADDAALAAVQALCPTQSAVAARATGFGSVAEAAALAWGGRLLRARWQFGMATAALAEAPER